MSKTEERGQAPQEAECLHCELMKVVEEHVGKQQTAGQQLNAGDITDKIVEVLAQFILDAVPPNERARLIAYTIQSFGQMLQMDEGEDTLH